MLTLPFLSQLGSKRQNQTDVCGGCGEHHVDGNIHVERDKW